MKLLTPETKQELDTVQSIIEKRGNFEIFFKKYCLIFLCLLLESNTESFWTSLTRHDDVTNTTNWYFITTGNDLNYHYEWATNQPSDIVSSRGEHPYCGQLWNLAQYKIDDHFCTTELSVMCEIDY